MNDLTLSSLQLLRRELADYGVVPALDLAAEPPLVMGQKTQLQEVSDIAAAGNVGEIVECRDRPSGLLRGRRQAAEKARYPEPDAIFVRACSGRGPGFAAHHHHNVCSRLRQNSSRWVRINHCKRFTRKPRRPKIGHRRLTLSRPECASHWP